MSNSIQFMSALKRIAALVVIFAIGIPVGAQSLSDGGATKTITKVGTTSAQFLKLGVGARAIGLGGTFVAEANDLSALYWNPAGLSKISGGAVQFSHTQYLANISYNYAAFGVNVGQLGTIAASLVYLDSGEMEVRTTATPEGTGELFKKQDLALQLSYAKALTDRFSIGTTFKYIREQIWHSSASAMAFDVGVLFTTPYQDLRLGASMSNFGPKMQMSGRDIIFSTDPTPNQSGNVEIVNSEYSMDQHPLPLMFRVGLAWDAVSTSNHQIVVMTDAAHPNDNSEYLNMGIEYKFRDLFALRSGYRNAFETDGEQGLTMGAGINLRMDKSTKASFDYAYADFGRLEQTHWYTFNLQF
ncbi:MAG: PorV/PorQ family protein [Bacteroidetes bacterium]|nr:PorV/PorQ family protein [Bacteroidota bacterium]